MPDDVDRKSDADKRNHDAEAITDAAGAPEPNQEPNLTGDNTNDRETNDREAVNDDNIIYMPISPRADAGGTGNHPPTHDADAAEQPEEGDGDGDNDGANDDDDDLDVLPYDELDEAAAQHKEDWRRPTVAWQEPVSGEQVFNGTVDIFNRFMILPEGAAEVVSFWVFSTYALHACNLPFAIRLIITAPGANSGKTTLLDLLTYLVRHPEPVSDITPASLYRSLNARKCVLLDEADHNLPSRAGTRNELIQLINSGHKRATAVVIRTESVKTPNGTIRVNRRYPIFAPFAAAGNGTFAPNTTRSRAYEVKLMRKMAHETVESFIPDEHAPMMREMRMKIHKFVLDNKNAIRNCRPVMDSDLLHNRQRDNSGVLLQIADVIGGQIPARARAAIKAMTRGDAQDIYEVLLEDIASILLDPEVMVNCAGTGQPPNMRHVGYNNCVFSADLCDLIVQYFPHRETYTGFTTARLATMLSRFDIEPEPRVKRRGSDNGTRWYRRDGFSPWFVRYGLEPPEVVAMEPAEESDASGEPGDTPAKGATSTRDVPDQEVAGSNVAPSTTPSEADETPAASPATLGEIIYPNAHVVEPGKGDRKRGDRLRAAVEAVMPESVPVPGFGRYSGVGRARNGARWHGRGSDWATPQDLYDEYDREFGFTLDVAASDWNAKTPNYFTDDNDGLSQDWGNNVCWCNPPYASALKDWMRKAYEASQAGATVVCLVPVSTDRPWWTEYAAKGEVRYVPGRPNFRTREGQRQQLMRPSAIVIFRPPAAAAPEPQPEPKPTAPQQAAPEIVYPNAHPIPFGQGEKKRASRLHREVDALVMAGTVDAGDVIYISSRFWVITRDGQPCFVHMDGNSLEWLPIAEPGLLAKDGVIRISPDKSLLLADSDFLILRPLVNKYRKLSVT